MKPRAWRLLPILAVIVMAAVLIYVVSMPHAWHVMNDKLVSSLTNSEAESFIAKGSIHGGMIPKVRSAFSTLGTGVRKVHIIDGRIKHSLLLEIFTDEGIGTQMIHES